MRVKQTIILIAVTTWSFQCLIAQDLSFKPKFNTVLDSSKGKELMKQCTRCIPKNIEKFWNVSDSDKMKLESVFKKVLKLKSTCGITFPNESISGLEYYLFQYIGVTIGNQEFIYINAFYIRNTKDLWKTEPVNVCDGGKGFWGALFDLEDLEFTEL